MGEGSKRGAARRDGFNASEASDPGRTKEADRRRRTSRLVSLVTRVRTVKGGCRLQTPHHVPDCAIIGIRSRSRQSAPTGEVALACADSGGVPQTPMAWLGHASQDLRLSA